MYSITFVGEPKYEAVVKSIGYIESISIDKYLKSLKSEIKLGNIKYFEEKDENIEYYNSSREYTILKQDLPDGILEEIRKLISIYNKEKQKAKEHPIIKYLLKVFKENEKKLNARKYLKYGILGFLGGFLSILVLALLNIQFFLYMHILSAITVSTIIGALTIGTAKYSESFKNIIKESINIIINRKYFKKSIKAKNVKKHKVVKISKSNKKTNDIKKRIIEEISIVQELIGKLSIENQKIYQKKLYELLENYRKKIEEVRNKKECLTLVYERDVDNYFFQSLINLGAEINIKLTTTDPNRYAEYDKTIEDIERELKESLTSTGDTPMARTRAKEEGQPFQI